ncbi:hypothetical protein GLOIN_2v1123939 [Rhizophagus irregularis DAOM 181602=DAOM 197198]|nr:hypothetical protein GLOIN_2v1123939 [Rhizophagus irregularis DAOM 181602=DAOM 197198]
MWKFSQLSRKKLETYSCLSRTARVNRSAVNKNCLLENKSVYGFDVVVSPKRKSTKWTVNIERTTLKDLKDYIRELYTPPALENDGAEPNFMSDEIDIHIGTILHSKRCCSCSCQLNLLYLLRRHQIHSATFPKVCELYGLSDDPSPKPNDRIETSSKITPLDMAYEATKSIYFHCYLASGVSFYEDDFKIIPEKLIEGLEFKREDFMKRFTQGSVQMESSLTGRKRKAEEIDDGLVVDREAQKPVEDSQSGDRNQKKLVKFAELEAENAKLRQIIKENTEFKAERKREGNDSGMSRILLMRQSLGLTETKEGGCARLHKRSVSDGIRRRKREKNLREDDSILKVSSQIESNTEALVASKDIPEVSINQKITYKQKMKQSLRNEPVSACTKSNCSWAKIVFDMEIPEFSLETILTGIQDLIESKQLLIAQVQFQSYSGHYRMIPPKANNTDEVTNCNAHVTEFSEVVCLEQKISRW